MHLGTRFLIIMALVAGTSLGQGVRFRDEVFQQVDVLPDVVYGSALNPWTGQIDTLCLDRYEPVGDTWPARPTVIVVHGGGFVAGDKAGADVAGIAQAFARRGYVAVSISYRLVPNVIIFGLNHVAVIEDVKEDFKASVRFLRSVAGPWGIDTERIAAIGTSAGAFAVLAGAYVPGEGQSGNPGFSSEVHAVVSLWGAMTDVSEIEAGEAPVCVIHGTDDPLVPYSAGLAVHQQALSVGVPAELHSIAGAGHAPYGAYFSDHLDDNLGFYWEHLRLGMLAGLDLSFAPGTLTLVATGLGGDRRWLGVSLTPSALNAPGLGVLCLDPATLTLIPVPDFPGTSRLPSDTLTASVPTSMQGITFWVQELRSDATGAPRLLTNCIEVSY